jgi:carbon monoxide dehydrogenase subunit G
MDREQVWPRIFDPACLMCLIPGCESIVQTGPDEYRGRFRFGAASIRGTYRSIVKIIEALPPEFCIFEGEMNGTAGVVRGQARFDLIDTGADCRIDYEARGIITGVLATIHPRFIRGIAESLIKIGLVGLNNQLKSQLPHVV